MADTDQQPKRPEPWDEGEEEEEEEAELSYEIFHPPPEEEMCYGTIIKDAIGFYNKKTPSEIDPENPQSCAENVVRRYTLCNTKGLAVQVITLGCTITSIRMPDNKNVISDLIMGFDTLEDYMDPDKNKFSFGSLFGRYNSVISNGRGTIGKEEVFLSTNVKGIHHEKGGFKGFDKVLWDSYVSYDKVVMTHVSPDHDEGYPGTLMIQVTFQLTQDNKLIVNTTAHTSKPTIMSLAHNLFFNLAGHETGVEGMKSHTILVNADKYVQIDYTENVPTGELEDVTSTYFDLRVPRPLYKAIRKLPKGGYDHAFCLTKGYPMKSVTFASRLIEVYSGRYVEIMTDMPCLHINSAIKLPNPDEKPPLEPQPGFFDNPLTPKFCREELKKQEIEDLQERMNEKQSWSREEEPTPDPELMEALGDLPKKLDEEVKEEGEEEGEENENAEPEEHLKFLKDIAGSDNEESELPKWTPPSPIIGRKGAKYIMNGAICLMTQEYPDCFKFSSYTKPILKPGETFTRTTIYKFGIAPVRKDREKIVYL